jgi:rod shape-determining protein MreD
VLLVAFQVLVLNNLGISYYINPYVYPLFIIMLPFSTPRWLLMLIAFVVGFTVDFFSNTAGMHAAATVFMAFLQPTVVRLFTSKTALETDDRPNIRTLGLTWFFTYASFLLLIHHFIYFLLEIFSLNNLFTTLSKTVLSCAVSMLFATLIAYLYSPEKKRT